MLGVGVSLRSLRSSVSSAALSAYAVEGFEPALVFDFDDEYYRTGGSDTTFDAAVTHSRDGNATMVDSDGVLKWVPHNLALNSATPATQSITVISGADYTVECTGVSIALSGAGTGTVTEGSPVEITASTTTLTLTVTGSTGTMWVYRSDLGGMVDNPDRGDSYVPTTDSAVYLPRRGHHVYNGSEWVNEGLLHESEARTNLVEHSSDLPNSYWSNIGGNRFRGVTSTNPTNETVTKFSVNAAADNIRLYSNPRTPSIISTFSFLAKADGISWIKSRIDIVGNFGGAYFDLSTGSIGTVDSGYTANIEPWGDGWYLCSTSVAAVTNQYAGLSLAEADGDVGLTGYSGSTSDGVLLTAFQWEDASTPSSYIPTSGSTVTRAADTLTVPSANLPWPEPTALSARNDLINNSGWIITDGGAA